APLEHGIVLLPLRRIARDVEAELVAPLADKARRIGDTERRQRRRGIGAASGDVCEAMVLVGVPVPFRCRRRVIAEALLADAQGLLDALQLGDVGAGDHRAAFAGARLLDPEPPPIAVAYIDGTRWIAVALEPPAHPAVAVGAERCGIDE